jgi:hypothetical protein
VKKIMPTMILCLAWSLPALAQHVWFNPPSSVPAEPDFEVTIELAAEGQTVQGLDILFSFNPDIVTLNGVTAGDWFTTSGLDHYFWLNPAPGGDPETAVQTAHISAALLGGGSAADGTLAVLSFTAENAGVSPLSFLSLTVRDDQNATLPATHSTGDEIIIDGSVPADSRTMSAVKALWR